ncbi:MAG: hypothetical protein JO154_00340 [Chitinophaga sp.]|uniref:hypothetical protein n=1 Tax=Chitinophaga sp. TaxID=1869181 RepID=UPI0025B9CF03|nr:hypothetical protein [Chitinophaga sp.]MBV8251026.1 hypothetical protein [Chitinophaga sp.]
MPFIILILLRIMFGASMVFVIGYVFGNFASQPVLAGITKVAVILGIVAFIAVNIILMRMAWHRNADGKCMRPWATERIEK